MSDTRLSSGAGISRRGFHRRLAAAAAGLAVAGGHRAGSAERAASAGPPAGKYVDMHTHLGQEWSPRGALSPEAMLRWMDEHAIARAVVLPLISPEGWYYPITTHWVLAQTRPHRDRLIPFCDVDPRTPNLGGFKGILDLLKRYVEAGAKGLGEHKCGVAVDDPRNLDVFRAVGELGLPILFHMDSIRNTDAPGLPGLERVLKEVPGSNFIGHAQAWWASISGDVEQSEMGGYPRGPVAPGGAIDRLMDEYPNLYGELSAGSGANAVRRDAEFGREFLIRRADRLLFGTDYLAPGQSIVQFELLESFDLPEDVKAGIYRGNAERILRLA
ncbi:MAG: amidohydrolase family protein [Planctomycetota bacterium]|jgi:predicted TIM-barrel fold metal-dependent hydrolase